MINKSNAAIAKRFVYYDKTVAVLEQSGNYDELIGLLQEQGYYVYQITEEDLRTKTADRIASVLIIPEAQNVDPSMAEAIERYRTCTGKILFIGGPLFGKRSIEEKYMVIEGISPQYKVYQENECKYFETVDSLHFSSELKAEEEINVICPVMRPNGEGFDMERKVRMIPCVNIVKEGGRDRGVRGTAAYFVLSDTSGHLTPTWASRPGSVTATTRGSAIGAIGISYDSLWKMQGGKKLICDMVDTLICGIYLFEGGSDTYICKKGERVKIGAKILCTGFDYVDAAIRVVIRDKNGFEMAEEMPVLLNPQQYTVASKEITLENEGEYVVTAELIVKDQIIDKTQNELLITGAKRTAAANEFMKIKNGDFILGDEKWYMHGINYWPLYHVSLELTDYWMGAFDKSFYIASEVDKDLAFLKAEGINCVAIRIEQTDMTRIVQPLKDFFYRCGKYGIKISLSVPGITNPLFFQEAAYHKFMKDFEIADNPTIFALDLAWEVGSHFCDKNTKDKWLPVWKAWLMEQYGSIEEAEQYTGITFDRDEAGNFVCPDCTGYFKEIDDKERIQLTLFRYCIEDHASRTWNKAIKKIKKLDSNHLIITRANCIYDDIPNGIIAHAEKHLDLVGLEGYSIELDETGFYASLAQAEAARFIGNNKPIAWVEYGISLVGASGYAVGTKMQWDKENMSAFDFKLEEQRRYQEQFDKAMTYTGVKGSLPWFYAGGFRSTECSDAGYVGPNGVMRAAGQEYKRAFEAGMYGTPEYTETETVLVDLDMAASGWPAIVFGKGRYSRLNIDLLKGAGEDVNLTREDGPGLAAMREAYQNKKGIVFKTNGTDTNSVNTPLEACANMEYKGKGPLKYLNAEFNTVLLKTENGTFELENGQTIDVKTGESVFAEIEFGNVSEAEWIAGSGETEFGAVYIKVSTEEGEQYLPIVKNTKRYEDAKAVGLIELNHCSKLTLEACAYGRASFGEKFVIHFNQI